MKQAEFTLIIGDPKQGKPDRLKVNISRLALQTGYSPSHLSRVFTQKTVPSIGCLEELSGVLRMNMTDLYNLIKEGEING